MSISQHPRALIIGGNGQLGVAIAQAMNEQEWSITTVQRNAGNFPRRLIDLGVSADQIDRSDKTAMRNLLSTGFDVVIDTICYTAEDADTLLSAQDHIGSIVVFSSSSVYRDAKGRTLDEAQQNGFPDFGGPISVSQSTVLAGDANYSTQKIAMEERFRNEAKVPVSIIRPSAIHGPYSHHPREWWFVKRILDGRTRIPLCYSGLSRFHTSSTSNIADLVLATLDNPDTRILNAADANSPTVLEIGQAIAAVMGRDVEFVPTEESPAKSLIGITPWTAKRPFVLDISDSSNIGYRPRYTYEEMVSQSVNWLTEVAGDKPWQEAFPILANYPIDLFDYDSEDRWFAEHA